MPNRLRQLFVPTESERRPGYGKPKQAAEPKRKPARKGKRK